jgi:hypothetical protein
MMNKNVLAAIAFVLLCFSQNLYAQVAPLPSNIEATWGELQDAKDGVGIIDYLNLLGKQGDYLYGYREDKNGRGATKKLTIEKYDKNTLALVEAVDCELVEGNEKKIHSLLKIELIGNKIVVIVASGEDRTRFVHGVVFSLETKKVETKKLLITRTYTGAAIVSATSPVLLTYSLSCTYENNFFFFPNYFIDEKKDLQIGFHLFDANLNLVQEYNKGLNENSLISLDTKITPEGTVIFLCNQKEKKGHAFIDNKPNYRFVVIEFKKEKEPALWFISAAEGEKHIVDEQIKLNYVSDSHISVAGVCDILDAKGQTTSETFYERNDYGLFSLTIEKKTGIVVKKLFISAESFFLPCYDKKSKQGKNYLKGRRQYYPSIHKISIQPDSSLLYITQLEQSFTQGQTQFNLAKDLVVCKISAEGQLVWKSIIEKVQLDHWPSSYAHVPKIIIKDGKMYYIYNNVIENFDKKAGEELVTFPKTRLGSPVGNCLAIAEIDLTNGETNKYILTKQTEAACVFLNVPTMILPTSPTSWTLVGKDGKGYRFGRFSIK